jgi:amino acid adenylation domain-containing protein
MYFPTLAATLERVAKQFPDRPALRCANHALSYQELDRRATSLAIRLQKKGVGPEVCVGVALERSVGLIVAICGILKAGGAYVPLDPEYPEQRLQYLMADAKPAIVILDNASKLKVGQVFAQFQVVEMLIEEPQACQDEALDRFVAPTIDADNLAYVIYTSGSTGGPKGNLISHRNVMRLLSQTQPWFEFSPEDIWPLLHSYAFDFSVWEIFGALCSGGLLVIPQLAEIRDPARLTAFLHENGVTILNQTPSFFYQLVHYLSTSPDAVTVFRQLSFIVFGGERLNLVALKPWFNLLGEDAPTLINMYGITETTVHVTLHEVTASEWMLRRSSSIGRPIPDLDLYLLNDNFESVAPGNVGELFVAGPGLARGYLGHPALSAEAFIPCPFGSEPCRRMYRTGDLAQIDAHGELVYISRKGGFIKIRGFRVSLEEIELALHDIPGVTGAKALLHHGDDGDCIQAFLVGDAMLAVPQLRAALARKLPAFMIPHQFFQADAMPLTHHGKVDMSALREQARAMVDHRQCGQPASEDESAMLAVWQRVLRSDKLGVSDDFFAAGGDSIRAVELVLALSRAGWHVAVDDIFISPNVRDLLDRSIATDEARTATPQKNRFQVSSMQATMLQQYQRHAASGNGVYHVQQSFSITDPALDVQRLASVMQAEFALHSIFRTVFQAAGASFVRTLSDQLRVRLAVTDISDQAQAHQAQTTKAWSNADLSESFTPLLADSPLARLTIFKLTSTCCRICLSVHHAIDDGWGQQQFFFRVFARYADQEQALAPPDDDSFDEYVALQQQAAGAALPSCWSASLFPQSMTVATSRELPSSVRQQRFYIDPDLTAQACKLARNQGIQAKALFLAAMCDAIGRVMQTHNVLIGVVVNGRMPQLSDPLNAMGLFWNIQPFAASNLSACLDMAMTVHRQLIAQEPFALYPLAAILDHHCAGREFMFSFNYTHFPAQALDGIRLHDWDGIDRFHYPVNFGLHLDSETQRHLLIITFDPACFNNAQTLALFEAFQQALNRIVGNDGNGQQANYISTNTLP